MNIMLFKKHKQFCANKSYNTTFQIFINTLMLKYSLTRPFFLFDIEKTKTNFQSHTTYIFYLAIHLISYEYWSPVTASNFYTKVITRATF